MRSNFLRYSFYKLSFIVACGLFYVFKAISAEDLLSYVRIPSSQGMCCLTTPLGICFPAHVLYYRLLYSVFLLICELHASWFSSPRARALTPTFLRKYYKSQNLSNFGRINPTFMKFSVSRPPPMVYGLYMVIWAFFTFVVLKCI